MFKRALVILLVTLSFSFASTSALAGGGKTKPKVNGYAMEQTDNTPKPTIFWYQFFLNWF